jgi:hypothetical protein
MFVCSYMRVSSYIRMLHMRMYVYDECVCVCVCVCVTYVTVSSVCRAAYQQSPCTPARLPHAPTIGIHARIHARIHAHFTHSLLVEHVASSEVVTSYHQSYMKVLQNLLTALSLSTCISTYLHVYMYMNEAAFCMLHAHIEMLISRCAFIHLRGTKGGLLGLILHLYTYSPPVRDSLICGTKSKSYEYMKYDHPK